MTTIGAGRAFVGSRPPRSNRPWRSLFGAALGIAFPLGVAVALAACSAIIPTPAANQGPSAPPGSILPAASLPASPVDGVIVRIDSSGLSDVHGFDLRTADGATISFRLGALENATQFAPGHLAEHEATAVPVRVFFRVEGGVPVVYRLEDAPP